MIYDFIQEIASLDDANMWKIADAGLLQFKLMSEGEMSSDKAE